MSGRQTRRSISIRGTTYERLKEHCGVTSVSMSDFLEQRIAEFFDDLAHEEGAPAPPPPSKRVRVPLDDRVTDDPEPRTHGPTIHKAPKIAEPPMRREPPSRPVPPAVARPVSGGSAKRPTRLSDPNGSWRTF